MAALTSRYLTGIKSIAIIGAGPSGLAAAKYFQAEDSFEKIAVFEQRASVGGIWNHTPIDATTGSTLPIPQTDPTGKIEDPLWRKKDGFTGKNGFMRTQEEVNLSENIHKEATFVSPLYDRLETNIPRQLMCFSDLDFSNNVQLFPSHVTVREYVERYAEDVQHLVQLETQVVNVQLIQENSNGTKDKWVIKTRSLQSGVENEEVYDAVIAANGHYDVPYVPDIQGIREWHAKYPGAITHSKFYRLPEKYTGKKVIVVGNNASGIDISTQIAQVSQLPVLLSAKSPSMLLPPGVAQDERKIDLPPIEAFLPETRGVRFESGRVENDIDAILFCTGYLYSFPFLSSLDPPLISDGTRVQHTYQHFFYTPNPTLSLLTLPQKIIPFPAAEVQSAVLARVYSGRLPLPSQAEMEQWEVDNVAERGSSGDFHILPFPKDANYINALHDWAQQADPADGKGKTPPRWGEWEFWARERFPKIKRAFGDCGEARRGVTRLEEVGFDFNAWKVENRE